MDEIITKKCFLCGTEKESCEFSPPSPSKKGRANNICKDCYNKRHRGYRAKDVEKARQYGRDRYHKDPDKANAMTRKWQSEHPETVKATFKERYSRNPDKILAKNRNRDAKIRGNVGGVTEREWKEVKDRHENKCLCCGASEVNLTMDHVVPLKLGGLHSADNIQPLCLSCNCSKGAKIADYRIAFPGIEIVKL